VVPLRKFRSVSIKPQSGEGLSLRSCGWLPSSRRAANGRVHCDGSGHTVCDVGSAAGTRVNRRGSMNLDCHIRAAARAGGFGRHGLGGTGCDGRAHHWDRSRGVGGDNRRRVVRRHDSPSSEDNIVIVSGHATESLQIRHAIIKLILKDLLVAMRRIAHLVVELLDRVLVCSEDLAYIMIDRHDWHRGLPLLT
jgi:hypothetical protein